MTSPYVNAYLLHSRKYTDSRIIVELLTQDFGVISGVYRVKTRKKIAASLPNFAPLLVSVGKGHNLKTIYDIESSALGLPLVSNALFAAMYVNELLLRVLPKDDVNEGVYQLYESVLAELNRLTHFSLADIEVPLRRFELKLLALLGYGLDFQCDTEGERILPEMLYRCDVEFGFTPIAINQNTGSVVKHQYSGEHLQLIAENNFSNSDVRKSAKLLTRMLLQPLLGDKPLKSRELFARQ